MTNPTNPDTLTADTLRAAVALDPEAQAKVRTWLDRMAAGTRADDVRIYGGPL